MRSNREAKIIRQLLKMRDRGEISEEVLILYGISGDLPDQAMYLQMSQDEQRELWTGRMENRYGSDWRAIFRNPPIFVKEAENKKQDWKIEGF